MRKLFLFIMSLSPALANAQAFATGYAGDKQHAMGNAGTGLALDAASMTYNPASISFLNGNSVSAGAAVAITNTAYLDSMNNSLSRTSNPVGVPFHINFVYGTKGSSTDVVNDSTGVKSVSTSPLDNFKFGLGVTTPYGGNSKWASDWTGRNAITVKSLGSIAIAPTVSYKIMDNLSVGAAFVYSESKLHVENALSQVSPDSKVVLDFTQRGIGFGAGIYYVPMEGLSVGLGYLSQVNSKSYKGTAKFTVPTVIDSLFPSGDATFKSSVPQVISLGFGYTGIEKLKLSFDVAYALWSCFDSTIFEYSAATASSTVSSTRLPNHYKDVFGIGLGAQYEVIDNLYARAGVSYNPTPVPDSLVYPDVPDANRINITGGIGYNITEAFSADLSYRFANLKEQGSRNVETGMSGIYKTYANVIGLSLNYKF